MRDLIRYVQFRVDDKRVAIFLHEILRIVRAVEITRLKAGDEQWLGVIDVEGELLPVMSLRKHLGAIPRPIRASDFFVLVNASGRRFALVVDSIDGVAEVEASQFVEARSLIRHPVGPAGVARGQEGLVVLEDLASIMLPEQQQQPAFSNGANHG